MPLSPGPLFFVAMDTGDRLEKVARAQLSKNRKLQEFLKHADAFAAIVEETAAKTAAAAAASDATDGNKDEDDEAKIVEGRDIAVCVRVRPMLDYEREAGFFGTAVTAHPKVKYHLLTESYVTLARCHS